MRASLFGRRVISYSSSCADLLSAVHGLASEVAHRRTGEIDDGHVGRGGDAQRVPAAPYEGPFADRHAAGAPRSGRFAVVCGPFPAARVAVPSGAGVWDTGGGKAVPQGASSASEARRRNQIRASDPLSHVLLVARAIAPHRSASGLPPLRRCAGALSRRPAPQAVHRVLAGARRTGHHGPARPTSPELRYAPSGTTTVQAAAPLLNARPSPWRPPRPRRRLLPGGPTHRARGRAGPGPPRCHRALV